MSTPHVTPNKHLTITEGLRLIARREHERVHASAISMIHANVNDPTPYYLLAHIAAEHGNHVKACELFEKAANLKPKNGAFQAHHAQALTILGYQTRAKSAADCANECPNEDAHIADTIGVVYSRTGYHDLAVPCFEKAVRLNPVPANFHYNLAASLQFLGDFAAAETAYRAALARDAKAYRAWSSLVSLKRQTETDNHLLELQALFDELKADADAALHLGHALAKTYEDLGQYESSFDWLKRAKQLKLEQSGESSLTGPDLFAAASATVDNQKAGRIPLKSAAITPIFVIGLPRTGTTLVDRILSSHSLVTSAGELNVFPGLIKEATKTRSNMVMDANTLRAAASVPLEDVGNAYLSELRNRSPGSRYVVDKMPFNFFYAGLIQHALPQARIIGLRRGAMDSCLSNYRQLLTVQHSYYHYTYDIELTADFYTQFVDLMRLWSKTLPDEQFMQVRYENIVHDQENQTRSLLDFCGLDFEEACMSFHENSAPVSTASSVQVRQPLYSGSIDRWKKYANKLEPLRRALGDYADA